MEEEKNDKKKAWFNNAIIFFVFAIIVVFILSIIGSLFNWEGTYLVKNAISGNLESKLISVESLFSREGIRYIVGNVVSNFISFKPLAMFLFILIGIGFAEKTGLFSYMFQSWTSKINKFWLTFIVVLISILSNLIGEVAFTLIIPISAILFLANNRNPIVAIFASFIGITTGTGINFIVSQISYDAINNILIGAKIIDPTYGFNINSGLFFGIIGSISLAFLITYITEKFTSKRLSKYKIEEVLDEDIIPKNKKKKAMFLCMIISVVLSIFFVYMLVPTGAPLSGLLLDYQEKDTLSRIFSPNSYVAEGLSFIILSMLLICGWIYGSITGTLKNNKNIPNYLFSSLNNLSGVLILLFFASQLIALFQKSNIGTVFTIWIADLIAGLNVSSLPLILIFFLLILVVNIIEPSSITKVAILGPIVTQKFMKSNVSPEFMNVVYKLGETTSDIITPLFPYFIVFLGVILIYSKKNEKIKIRDIYKLLLPYFLVITIFWLIFILCWFIINIPIGIDVYPSL